MDQSESVLDMARRCTAEAQGCVERQTAIVEKLVRDGHNAAEAQTKLSILRDALALMRKVVARYQA